MTIKLHSEIKGEGEKILILHGLFGSLDNLRRIAIELSEYFQVHSLDLRNHGKSGHAKEMNYTVMSEDVIGYMNNNNITQANVIGHSMGGKVAMTLALNFKDRIKKIIVADISPVSYSAHHTNIFKGLFAVDFDAVHSRKEVDTVLSNSIPELGIRQFLIKNLDRDDFGGLKWKMNLPNIYENYSNILKGLESEVKVFDKPVLFIAGGDSDYIKPTYKALTLALFPLANVKVIPGTTHWLHAEKPRLFINICLRFLQEQAV